jgi:hypothetical protein
MREREFRLWRILKKENTPAKARIPAKVRVAARRATTGVKARTPARAKEAAPPINRPEFRLAWFPVRTRGSYLGGSVILTSAFDSGPPAEEKP